MKINKKGFTLVETIITFALLMLVIGLSSTLIIFSGNITSRESAKNNEKLIGDTIYDFIVKKAGYATNMTIENPGTANNLGMGIDVQDGRLRYSIDNGSFEDIFGEAFYSGYTIETNIKPLDDGKQLSVEVIVNKDDNERYRVGSTINVMNMGLNKNLIKNNSTDSKDAVILFNTKDVVSGVVGGADPVVQALMNKVASENSFYITQREIFRSSLWGSPEPTAAEEQIKTHFNISNTTPSRDSYFSTVKELCGGQWPEFTKERLDVLKYSDDSDVVELYNYITKYTPLVRPYYLISDGEISDQIYYVVLDGTNGEQWRGRLVYNDRDNSWYLYKGVVSPTTRNYGYHPMTRYTTGFSTFDILRDEMESGVTNDGYQWIKL